MVNSVEITRSAKKDLRGCPTHGRLGGKGLRDEALVGDREGQRSVRLSRGYRAFYVLRNGEVQLVSVIQVNKHEY